MSSRQPEHVPGVLAEVVTPYERAMARAQKRDSKERERLAGTSNADFESKHPRGGKGSSEGGKFIRKGSSGSAVAGLQRRLGGLDDGKFGPNTETLVRAFQRRYGLTVDGVVGRQTATALLGDAKAARKVKTGRMSKSQRRQLAKRKRSTTRTQGGVLV